MTLTTEVIEVLGTLICVARVAAPLVTFWVAAYMYRRVVHQSRVMRMMGINGEIELVHNGWRRDSSMLMAASAVMLISSLAAIYRHDMLADGDDVAMVALSVMMAWVGVQRLRDRRIAEILASTKRRAAAEGPKEAA